jgi:DNA-binding NarL/FixJ family response regulator
MPRARVLIADDHPSILVRVSEVLSPEFDVVATVVDGLAAVDASVVLQPDVVILDMSMPILSGLEAAGRIADSPRAPRIVFLTVHEDPQFIDAARRAGGHGYVLKRTIAARLVPAIRSVLAGQPAFPRVDRGGGADS